MHAGTDPPLLFETGAVSHAGLVRSANEDSHVLRPECGIWAVADGMGGHRNGALASRTLAEAITALDRSGSAPALLEGLEAAVIAANAAMRRLARENGGGPMGSTLAALLVHGGHFACVWAGDSRVYLLRAGRIAQISHDHTEVQELVDRGTITAEEALTWPRRHVITRAIGVHDRPELEIEQGAIAAGDVFLICSDGLTNHVGEAEIGAAIAEAPAQQACEALLGLVLERGAEDNVTIVVIRCCRTRDEPTRWMPNRRAAAGEAA